VSTQTVTKHRSSRTKCERGIYRRPSAGSPTGFLYSVYHQNRFVSSEADGTPLYELKAARARRGELIGQSNRGEKPIVASKLTFGELADSWLEIKASRLRPRTKAYYEDTLRLVLIPRFGTRKIASIDVESIAKLIRDLEARGLNAVDPARPVRPLGRSSIENYCKPLGQVLDLAVRRKLIAVNPCNLLRKDERPARGERRVEPDFSDEVFDRLFAAAKEIAGQSTSRQDYEFLLRLTQRLALRLGETLGLQWGDLDKERGVLHIRRQWLRGGEYGDPKTADGKREILLPTGLQNELLALRLASPHSADTDPVFSSREGTPLSHRNVVRRGLEAAVTKAGLPNIQFHDLRRAGISRWIANGVDPVLAAKMAGHRDARITIAIYTKLYNAEAQAEAVRAAIG
jgi:integrase